MKIFTAIISGITLTALVLPAFADHNSKFGDNTGRTVAGVHDDRIDSNTKSSTNSSAMSNNTASVRASGTLGSYAQGGSPETIDSDLSDGISLFRSLGLF